METRRIGSLTVSLAGLGGNNFGRRLDEGGSRRVIQAALDAGITHFDTAATYSDGASETLLGKALGSRRGEVVVTTKFGHGQPPDGVSPGDPQEVRRSCEESLRRLGSSYIDLYLLHRPDPATPIGETLSAMNELLVQGKVREIGCSNFSAAQLADADAAAAELGLRSFVCVQNRYNLLERAAEQDAIPACESMGLAFVPFFPLAAGLLSGKYRRGRPAPAGTRLTGSGQQASEDVVEQEKLIRVERLAGFAERAGHSLLELALSWLAARPQVASVIAGAMTPEQVRANVAALSAWRLTDQELAEIDRLSAV